MPNSRPSPLPTPPRPTSLPPAICDEIAATIMGALETLLNRQRESYPFIDTKFSIATGENFPSDDPLRGRNVVYTWIQGRALEALAGHAVWLQASGGTGSTGAEHGAPLEGTGHTEQIERITALLARIGESLEAARSFNHGRLPFMMDLGSRPLAPLPSSTSMAELFHAKGLMAASHLLGKKAWANRAEELFASVVADIRSGAFQLGQVAFDPKNPVAAVPGRFTHAGRMIALGGFPIFFQATGALHYRDTGLEFIRHILAHHTAAVEEGPFKKADFWEYLDAADAPWENAEGEIVSDPGHATEFVGLALAHLRACSIRDTELEQQLLHVLEQNFANGFTGIGIVKSYDLKARRPIHSDMPWWSLPETMRAAALGLLVAAMKSRGARWRRSYTSATPLSASITSSRARDRWRCRPCMPTALSRQPSRPCPMPTRATTRV